MSVAPQMTPAPEAQTRLSQGEFIALIAMLFATIAFSIDAMLPALPVIGEQLSPADPDRAHLVVSSFFLGMGIATFFTGPLSDRFGRKTVIIGCGLLYCVATVICIFAQSLEVLLAARVLQGIGGAGPRTVSLALVRDLYRGREMARIMSFAMMVFMLAPAVAPLMGQTIMLFADWHAIFVVFIFVSAIWMIWLGLRQPETLPVEARKPFSIASLWQAARELTSYKVACLSIVIQGLTTAVLMSTISSIQAIYEQHFNMADSFPLWFAGGATVAAAASLLNARLVMVWGMRKVANRAYIVAFTVSVAHLATLFVLPADSALAFPCFFLWTVTMFGMMSLTMGNLNALAMEPLGRIAGFAASFMGGSSTVLAVVLGVPVGLMFDGTALPLVTASVVFLAAALMLMPQLGRPSS